MTDTLELSRQLNACIKDSDVYKNYQYCKDKLRQKPEKLQQFMEFRKKNYEIQNNEMLDNPYDEVNNLFMEYDSIVHDTIVNDFIRAEQKLVNIITTASELGYINIPDNTLIDISEMKNYPDEKVVLITTGSQGENMAALSRIAASIHNKVAIKPGDVVIFSSHPIPGNEKAVFKVINELEAKGAHVIFEDTHVSGHACREELKLIYALTRPKYAIPVHGEYRHLKRHAELAVEMGIPKENVKIMTTGDVLEIGEEKFDVVGKVPAQGVFVDGLGVGDVGNIVLRDRQLLSQNGLIIIVVTLDRYSNQLVAGPDIVSRGFVYVRESETLMEDCRITCQEALDRCLSRGVTDWGKIKSVIKDDMGEFLWKRTKRSPMILPIITEV